MKKIFLLFAAAVAVLSSCVKENGLEPQVNTDGKVTINAVAVDSKTVLDGLNVVWENEDALSVVLAGDVKTVAEFAAESVDGANAKFVYAGDDALAFDGVTSAYAVYPASAVSQEGGVVKVSHTLPEVQTGVVESGMNLSSAALSVEELVAGQATAQFKNALALLQVVVPAGVSEVSLHTATGSALVGDMTFNVVDGALTVASTGTKRTVTLSTGSELAKGTHSLLVYPGNAPTLKLTMKATDGAEYTSEVSNIRFTASESRTINLTQIFKMGTEETMYASPAGGEVVVPVVTAADYTYEVAIEGNPEWLAYSLPTKAFHGENIVFTAAQNDTGVERSANVTISWGEDQTRAFTIVQKAIYTDFVYDAAANLIQWEETFGVYGSESDALAGTNVAKTYTNVFTIDISDDFSKGVYKITNMFITAAYQNQQTFQTIYGKGGEYYADYADGVLTVHTKNALRSYFFNENDLTLTYDATSKTFAMATPAQFSANAYNSDYTKSGYIGKYSAAVYVETPVEPEGPSDNGGLEAFVGTWTETYVNKPYSWSEETVYEGEFTVSVVDGKLYFENMFIYKMYSTVYTANYYGTLSEDGKTITLEDAGSGHGNFGPLSYAGGPIVLTVDGNTLKVDSAYNGNVANYVATKQVPVDPLEAFVGTWTETYVNKPYSWSDETVYEGEFTVSVVDGKLYFENMFIYKMYSTVYTANYYGTLSEDGKTITLEDAGSGHGNFGPLSYAGGPIVLTVDGNTLKVDSAYNGNVANYVATKQ